MKVTVCPTSLKVIVSEFSIRVPERLAVVAHGFPESPSEAEIVVPFCAIVPFAPVVTPNFDDVAEKIQLPAILIGPLRVGEVPPPPPPQLTAMKTSASRNMEVPATLNRGSRTIAINEISIRAVSAPNAVGQFRLNGRPPSRKPLDDANVVPQVIVALAVSEAALKLIRFGAVKLGAEPLKLHVGTSIAPVGAAVTVALKATVPANPVAPVTVITQEPDCPGAVIVIVELPQPGATVKPGPVTETVTGAETALAA
jgi:hypothetical protein